MRRNSPKSPICEIRLPAEEATIAAAIALAERFCATVGCSGEWRARLLILIEELVANLIDHGRAPEGSTIGLRLALAGDVSIRLDITDCGGPFDPRIAAPDEAALPPEDGRGGAGLRLLAAWAVILDYASVEGVNRLRIDVPRPEAG